MTERNAQVVLGEFAGLPQIRIGQEQRPHWKHSGDGMLSFETHVHPEMGWASFDIEEFTKPANGERQVSKRVMFTFDRPQAEALRDFLTAWLDPANNWKASD